MHNAGAKSRTCADDDFDLLADSAVVGRSAASWVSTLKEENVRVRATPFLVALLVLSNDNSKAHARAPIAVLAGYAKS